MKIVIPFNHFNFLIDDSLFWRGIFNIYYREVCQRVETASYLSLIQIIIVINRFPGNLI